MGLPSTGLLAESVRRIDVPWEMRFKTKHLGPNRFIVIEESSGKVIDAEERPYVDAQFLADECNRRLIEKRIG